MTLLDDARAAAVPVAAVPAEDVMLPRPFRVVARRQDTPDTATLDLVPADGGGPLAFRAGQFTMMYAFGVGEVPVSISGDPGRPEVLRHTVRDVGAVTHAIVAARPGDVLGIRGPYGTAWDVADAQGGDVLFVAGGIGLAPLRPAILEVVHHRERYGRVMLLHGARSADGFLFADEVEAWAADGGVAVHQGVRAGLARELSPEAGFDPGRTTALMCGPDVMMSVAARTLVDRGVPGARVRLSLERAMQCGVGLCGHCQLRELFLCVDGPVLPFDRTATLLETGDL